jgi:hypothetical protein
MPLALTGTILMVVYPSVKGGNQNHMPRPHVDDGAGLTVPRDPMHHVPRLERGVGAPEPSGPAEPEE